MLVYKSTGDLRYDGLGAIVIGVVLAILAFILVLGVVDLIIGRSASIQTEKRITEVALSTISSS